MMIILQDTITLERIMLMTKALVRVFKSLCQSVLKGFYESVWVNLWRFWIGNPWVISPTTW